MDTLTVSALVDELARRNIQVSADGERLHLDGPAGSLTPELRERLREHKAGLLTHLRNPDADERPVNLAVELEQAIRQAQSWRELETALERTQTAYKAGDLDTEAVERLATQAAQEAQAMPEQTDDLRLSHLFDEAPIRRVHSKILNEVVVFAADGVELPADLEGVVYRASELRQMPGRSPEQVRAIHQVKREFDGELIP